MRPLADLRFAEAQHFGQLAVTFHSNVADMHGFMDSRLKATSRFLQFLENTSELRFATDAAVPHSYAYGRWPDDEPIGGYTDKTGIAPTSLISAVVDHWDAGTRDLSTLHRLLRSSLFVGQQHDLQAAVEYIVELTRFGHVTQGQSAFRALELILDARQRTESDYDAIELIVGEPSPTTSAEWHTAFRTPAEDRPQAPGIPGRTDAIRERLLLCGLNEIEAFRAAPTFDDWYVGRARIWSTLWLVLQLLKVEEITPAASAALSQLEEIHVDSGFPLEMAVGLAAAYLPVPSFKGALPDPKGDLVAAFKDTYGEEWAERLVDERAVLPSAISPSFLQHPIDIPPQWTHLSWRLAHAWLRARARQISPLFMRVPPLNPHLLSVEPNLAGILDGLSVPESDRADLVTNIYLGYGSTPIDLAEEDRQRLIEAVAGAHLLVAAREISVTTGQLDAAKRERDSATAKTVLADALELYPWNEFLHRVLAMEKFGEGDLDGARESALAAAFLDPTMHDTWTLLAATLTQQGRSEEASLASFFAADGSSLWR